MWCLIRPSLSIFEALSNCHGWKLLYRPKFEHVQGIWLSNKHIAVVHQSLIVFANINLKVIVVAPCDEALNHSFVFLSESKTS